MATRVRSHRGNKVLYLYGITKRPVSPVPRVAGVDGEAPIEPLLCAGLIAWVSRVSRSEFADNLTRNMENLDWLAAVSVRHQRTVSAIAESAEILPARFGTVFLSESSLTSDIQARKGTLEADFKRIKGTDEWGVKVFSLRHKVELPIATTKSGKDYLRAKAAMLRRTSIKTANPEVARFAQALERLAVETTVGGKISSGQRDLQWQASLLLKRTDRRRLEALLSRFSADWKNTRRIECTGPWPPYSFVSRNDAQPAASHPN